MCYGLQPSATGGDPVCHGAAALRVGGGNLACQVEGCWLECRQLMQQLHWRIAARRRRVARESRWCEAESERLRQQLASQECMHAAAASCT